MRTIRAVFAVLVIILLAAPGASPGAAPKEKKLIEFGWDEPDTAFLRRHVRRMEQTPFDGCVFHANYTKPDGKNTGSFVWECWSLLSPFLDGMLDAAEPGDKLIDGCELAYGYEDPAQFDRMYKTMREGVLPFVGADHAKYRQVFSFGFGIWMDNQHRKVGWNTEDHSKNYFTPEEFERSARKAIETADEYVWIYTEIPRWWSAENNGGPVKLPPAYDKALRKAAGRD